MFFDFEKQKWDKKYLDVLGIDETFLPLVKSPLDNVGTIKKEIADKFGFTYDTKIICGSTDTAMEVFASGAVQTGDTTIKLATAGRICVVSDKLTPDPQIINYSHVIKGLFYPSTATKSCAASLRWFRDTFGDSFEEYAVNKCSAIIGETIPNFENNKKYAQIFEKYKKVQVLLKEIYND